MVLEQNPVSDEVPSFLKDDDITIIQDRDRAFSPDWNGELLFTCLVKLISCPLSTSLSIMTFIQPGR
jgi:hypothetical protein